MEKIKPLDAALIGFDIVAGSGVDVILTGIAKNVVPSAFGLPGLIQKTCIKAATLGISFIAAEAMDSVVRSYAKMLAEEFQKELDKELKPN